MATRANTFSPENIELLFQTHPWLEVLTKDYRNSIIRLTAEVYDLIENNGSRLAYTVAESRVRSLFIESPSPDVAAKRFLEQSTVSWRTLRDSHDNEGNRFLHVTSEGRAFLEMLQRLMLSRNQFTAVGADRMLLSLNTIISNPDGLSKEDAIKKHKEEIAKLEADIKRIEAGSIKDSEILQGGHSPMELFLDAQDVGSSFLVGAHKLRNEIRNVRSKVFDSYSANRKVGEQVELAIDFHKGLEQTETYKSYQRAKELFSYIDSSTAKYPIQNVDRVLAILREKNLVDRDTVLSSPMMRFMSEFRSINQEIDAEVAKQINMLRLQVYYATAGENQLVNQNLKDISSMLFQDGVLSKEFLDQYNFSFADGLDISLSTPGLHSLEKSERIEIDEIVENDMTEEEERRMHEEIKKADEASVKQVLTKLRTHLASQGSVLLSDYPINLGVVEYYVLAKADLFDRSFKIIKTGRADIPIDSKRGRQWIISSPNVRIELV